MRLLVCLVVIIGVSFVQASSPCDLVRCRSNHVCKEKSIVECQDGEGCQNKLSPVCVPLNKTGTCPRQDITESAESNCENDIDCESNLKCCQATNKKSYCFRPCRKMFCKCGADMKMLEVFNSKGCAICSCVPRDDKRTVESTNDCLLPMETGKCRARFLRYYYNSESKQCEKFYYGGCSANKNNFFTKQACENKCLPEKKVETKCEHEPERGLCKGHMERFFFNKTANECQQFVYGGCRGNDNNFETVDLCNQECNQKTPLSAMSTSVAADRPKNFCGIDADSGPCFAHFEKYFFNKKSRKCEKFVYGGCLGNENRFDTEEECQKSCLLQQQAPTPKCKLEKKPGLCEAYIERFFYNETAMECQMFVYGGCGGNENNFFTEELCQQECLPLPSTAAIEPVTKEPVAVQDPSTFNINSCSLKKDIGPCLAYLEMYFFNVDTAKCERFVYGGCMGNENRFQTLKECESSCAHRYAQATSQVCQLPKRMGTCRGHIERYFYNDTVKECQKFVYSGCDGNANNFDTLDQCTRQCATASNDLQVCQLAKDSGPCYAYFEMFHYNAGSKRCEKFVYGGCGGNGNKFATEEKCLSTCQVAREAPALNTEVATILNVCSMEKAPGPCRGFYEKFFYNSTTKECQKFTYGGCMGNENNFDTEEECSQKCALQKSPEPEEPQLQPAIINKAESFNDADCLLPSEPGQCFAYIPSFYFNIESGRCESFVYGGCGGNSNRFEMKEECETACNKVNQEQLMQKEKCQMDVDPGMCRGYFEKYFYNQESKACELFVYGGCGGNRNNFDSEQACNMECGSGS